MNTPARLWASLSRDQRWIILAVFLAGVAEGLWLNLQALYLEYLGASPEQVGAALGLANVVVIFVYLPAGMLADRGRRKLILLTAWAITVGALILMGLAPDWRWAVPGLMLFLLASFARPAFSAQIAASDISGNASRAFAISSISYSVGALLSPAAGGWIGEIWGLRTVYFVSAVSYFLSMLCFVPLRETAGRGPRTAMPIRQLATDRRFLWQIAVVMLITFSLYLGVTLMPNYLQAVKGLRLDEVGQLGTVSAAGMLALTAWLGSLPAMRRRALLIAQGTVFAALALLLAAPAGLSPMLVAAALLRGGVDATWAPIAGRLSAWLPPEALSVGFAFRDTAVRIGLTLAPVTAGLLYAVDPAWPLFAGLAALGVTAALTLTLPRAVETRRIASLPHAAAAASPPPDPTP